MPTRAAVLLASAARTTTVTSEQISSGGAGHLTLCIDVTALAATPAVTPAVQVQEISGGAWKAIWTAAAAITDVTGTGTYLYAIGVGLLASVPGGYTDVENVVLPPVFRIVLTHGDADSITYSASYHLSD